MLAYHLSLPSSRTTRKRDALKIHRSYTQKQAARRIKIAYEVTNFLNA